MQDVKYSKQSVKNCDGKVSASHLQVKLFERKYLTLTMTVAEAFQDEEAKTICNKLLPVSRYSIPQFLLAQLYILPMEIPYNHSIGSTMTS